MPIGSATSEHSSGESTTHFASIRIRVVGTGKLRLSVFSLDDMISKALVPLDIPDKARYSLTRLVNFTEQRASFTISVQDMGEEFRINRMVFFTKELYKSYPGS